MSNEEHQILEALQQYFDMTTTEDFSSHKILRIDLNGHYYLISFFDKKNGTIKVAIINSNFEVSQFADVHQPLILKKPETVIAAESDGALIELVWRPCKISYSPFYPFWRVSAKDEIYYVDRGGKIYSATDLDKKRPG
jgi:hypothetical protein